MHRFVYRVYSRALVVAKNGVERDQKVVDAKLGYELNQLSVSLS